jgi:hypothetical protein
MRGLTLLIATILTLGYGFAAQAAMTLDIRRAGAALPETVASTTNRIWYGGTLAPVTVEAPAKLDKCDERTNL